MKSKVVLGLGKFIIKRGIKNLGTKKRKIRLKSFIKPVRGSKILYRAGKIGLRRKVFKNKII